eukprot:m.151051 g.151051  ORF g.151051 m.151051 type:complete len:237 (-) comp17399_c0_seq2:35-745(-)
MGGSDGVGPQQTGPLLRIGVLALQGAFAEHVSHLKRVGAAPGAVPLEVCEVRTPQQLEGLDGLVLPGGESTTMALVAARNGILEPLKAYCASHPVFGTCAGLIMLSERVLHTKEGGQSVLGGLDVTASRNFFGTQLKSFETAMTVAKGIPGLGADEGEFRAMFIRAPAIVDVGDGVEVLALLPEEQRPQGCPTGTCIVAAQQADKILVTAFHPELTSDLRWHQHFVDMVAKHTKAT